MGDAYGSGLGGHAGYPNYVQLLPYYVYQQGTGYGLGQNYYRQESQSAYGQNQYMNLGWGQQRGGRGNSQGGQGGYKSRGLSRGFGSSQLGGYGVGEGNASNCGSSAGLIDCASASYEGDQQGGFGKGDGKVIQQDTIFVSCMDPSLTEEDIANHFESIGTIKEDQHTNKKKIWLYKDKSTGLSKGEATVTYDDCNTAQTAIFWFNNKDFRGSVVKVRMATEKDNPSPGGGRGGGRGSFGDRGGRGRGGGYAGRGGGIFTRGGGNGGRHSELRDGDWTCPNSACANANFSWRISCNWCGNPKSGAVGDGKDEKRENAGRPANRGNRGFRGFGRGRGDGGRGFRGRDAGRPKPY